MEGLLSASRHAVRYAPQKGDGCCFLCGFRMLIYGFMGFWFLMAFLWFYGFFWFSGYVVFVVLWVKKMPTQRGPQVFVYFSFYQLGVPGIFDPPPQ